MDTDNLVTHAKARFDYAAAKKLLKEKYQAKLIFAAYDGMWRASPELILLLKTVDTEFMVLEDLYGNPCEVNRNVLSQVVLSRWQEQMNAWFVEFQALNERK